MGSLEEWPDILHYDGQNFRTMSVSHELMHHSLLHPLATVRHRTLRGEYEILTYAQDFIPEMKDLRRNPLPALLLPY
jgi:hypothetical protein